MQKRTNNFYKIRENKFNSNIPKKVFENNAFEQFDKFNKTESKTYAKNIINSPNINERRKLDINDDYNFVKNIDDNYLYEPGKINKNNFINEENNPEMKYRYNTEYKLENNNINYIQLQSKIYKNVVKQIYNNLYKYCKKTILNDYSVLLNKLKEFPPKKKPIQKTYKKKNIVNKTLYKLKKTPDKFIQNKNKNIITSFPNQYNATNTNNKKFNQNTFNDNIRKNVVYSNYYNLNIFENSNAYVYPNGRNKTIFPKELTYNDDIYYEENNKINNQRKSSENLKNTDIYKNKNFQTSIKRKPKINYTQYRSKKIEISPEKIELKVDNKNSLAFVGFSTKKKIIDKLKNIKLFGKSNQNDIKENEEDDELDSKKKNFKILVNKLKNIAFCKHMENYIEKRKKKIFTKLKEYNKNVLEINLENNINNNNNNNNVNKSVENIEENKENGNNINLNKENSSENIEIINDNSEKKIVINKNIENNIEQSEILNNIETNINNIEYEIIDIKEKNIIYDKLDKNKFNNNNDIINNNENINYEIKIEEKLNKKESYEEIDKNEDNLNNLNNVKEQIEFDDNNKNDEKNSENSNKEILEKEEIINKRNNFLQKIIKIILLKEDKNIIKNFFIKWIQYKNEINNLKTKDKINILDYKNDIKVEELKLENGKEKKEEKRNVINIKTLFIEGIDEEEKNDILEEMVFRFRTLLISSSLNSKDNFSDSF